jgi:hypothetical protein
VNLLHAVVFQPKSNLQIKLSLSETLIRPVETK